MAAIKLIKAGKTSYLVSACNEVVSFTNLKTGEVALQLYEKEAIHGQVSCVATSGDLVAVGYTSGTILVYQAEESEALKFEQVHQFSFHKSAVNVIIFAEDGTQLISGGADSYIILYDLVASTAEYKLIGHTGPVTQLHTIVTPHPVRGTTQRSLISASADGLLKVWDL